MQNDQKYYLTSDLANILGVPRSTVADWLKQYAAYLESELYGKRRAYLPSALEVLQKIAGWKNAGSSNAEIERLLAENYGLRPEVAPEGVPGAEKNEAPEAGLSGETAVAVAEGGELAVKYLSLPSNAEELEKLIGCFRQIETEQRRANNRRWLIPWLLTLLTAVVLGGIYCVGQQVLKAVLKENESISRELAAAGEQREQLRISNEKNLDELKRSMEHSGQQYSENITRINRELVSQRESFTAEIKRLQEDAKLRREAEMLQLKNEFARKQKAELERLEKLSAELAAAKKREEKLRQEFQEKLREQQQLHLNESAQKIAEPSPAPAAAEIPAGQETNITAEQK